MSNRLLVSGSTGETRIARVDEGGLADIALLRGQRQDLAGRVFIGRVQRVVPALDAAFVHVGQEADGFLTASAVRNEAAKQGINRRVHEGEVMLVQALGPGSGDKGLRLTTQISLRGRFLGLQPFTPPREEDALAPLRHRFDLPGTLTPLTKAPPEDAALLRLDAENLGQRWAAIEQRRNETDLAELLDEGEPNLVHAIRPMLGADALPIVVDDAESFAMLHGWCSVQAPDIAALLTRHSGPDLFESSGVEADLAIALARIVPLPGGGRLIIEPTEALVSVDVDSGGGTAGPDRRSNARSVNMEALTALVRQIRLRRLAGLIAVDFIHMRHPSDRKAVTEKLEAAFAQDEVTTRMAPVPAFGLAVLNRQRVREPLASWFLQSQADATPVWQIEAAALRLLRDAERATRNDRARRAPVLRVGTAVAAHLSQSELLKTFEARTGVLPDVRTDATMAADAGQTSAS